MIGRILLFFWALGFGNFYQSDALYLSDNDTENVFRSLGIYYTDSTTSSKSAEYRGGEMGVEVKNMVETYIRETYGIDLNAPVDMNEAVDQSVKALGAMSRDAKKQ